MVEVFLVVLDLFLGDVGETDPGGQSNELSGVASPLHRVVLVVAAHFILLVHFGLVLSHLLFDVAAVLFQSVQTGVTVLHGLLLRLDLRLLGQFGEHVGGVRSECRSMDLVHKCHRDIVQEK